MVQELLVSFISLVSLLSVGRFLSRLCASNSPMLSGGMFGNIVNKNARSALKEYGDRNGVGVDYEEVVNGASGNPMVVPQFTVVARVGERSFDPATASTKKDAKEYAADLALRVLAQGNVHS